MIDDRDRTGICGRCGEITIGYTHRVMSGCMDLLVCSVCGIEAVLEADRLINKDQVIGRITVTRLV